MNRFLYIGLCVFIGFLVSGCSDDAKLTPQYPVAKKDEEMTKEERIDRIKKSPLPEAERQRQIAKIESELPTGK